MATKIFVNLPVKNLEKSKEFFTQLGFAINPQFSDDTAACVVISEDIYAMILTHEKFAQFTKRQIANANEVTEVITALSADSRLQVDALFDKAIKAGATQARDAEDHGFMYLRSFNDPDGHMWEVFWMDPAFAQQPKTEEVSTN